jgi:hypothetical protein
MRKLMVMMLAFLSIVSACDKGQPTHEVPEFVEVELTVHPETGKVNQPIVFEAKVTQGNESVEDAQEVKFEIWRAQDENHEKILVEHAGNGIYRLEKTFEEEGTYYIISHVTARDMHNMPKKEFIIGQPSEPEDQKNAHDSMEDMEEH